MLNIHSKGKPLAEDVTLDLIAEERLDFPAPTCKNLMNEAAILAAKEKKEKKVSQFDLIRSIEKSFARAGKKKPLIDGGRKRKSLLITKPTTPWFLLF